MIYARNNVRTESRVEESTMNHGYAVYFRQSHNGIEVELLGPVYSSIHLAVAEASEMNSKAPNLAAFVREVYVPWTV